MKFISVVALLVSATAVAAGPIDYHCTWIQHERCPGDKYCKWSYGKCLYVWYNDCPGPADYVATQGKVCGTPLW